MLFIAGTYDDFSSTSCYSELAFLGNIEGGDPEHLDPAVVKYLETQLGGGSVTGIILNLMDNLHFNNTYLFYFSC